MGGGGEGRGKDIYWYTNYTHLGGGGLIYPTVTYVRVQYRIR
jgi:hypothetical protein